MSEQRGSAGARGQRSVTDGNLDVLAFGPHPDDIEIGCAGTLVRLRGMGYRVGIVDLTAGEMGTRGTPETRQAECQASARVMDISYRANLGLPDGEIQATPEASEAIARVIRSTRPSLILVPYPEDRHPDHVVAGRMVPEAAFRAGLKKWNAGQPAHRPLAVAYYMLHDTFTPTFVVDVTEQWATKIETLRCYRTQFAVPGAPQDEEPTLISSPEFLERIEARGRYFGSKIAVRYGEPIYFRETLRVDDPMMLVHGSVERFGSHRGNHP